MAHHTNKREKPAVLMGIALLVLVAGSQSSAFAQIILDTFSNGPHSTSFLGTGTGAATPSSVSGAFGNDPIGNSRRITAVKTNPTASGLEGVGISAAGGVLSVGGSPNAGGHSGVQYGTTGDLNLDLSGAAYLRLDFVAAVSDLKLNLVVNTTGVGSSGIFTFAIPTATSVDIPLSSLTGSALLNDIDFLNFDFYTLVGGYSAQITMISVPEPSGFALAMVGAIIVTLRRRFKVLHTG